MSGRVTCLVPHCRRTRKHDSRYSEWICSVHWTMVSKRTKAKRVLHNRFVRREIRRRPMVREYWKMRPGSSERIRAVRMWWLSDQLWERCKREAIERAAGL